MNSSFHKHHSAVPMNEQLVRKEWFRRTGRCAKHLDHLREQSIEATEYYSCRIRLFMFSTFDMAAERSSNATR
jgi:hypothetical protein